MRHATRLITLLLCAAGMLSLRSDTSAQSQSTLSAIGFIDYMRPRHFKVGDWVKYHRSGRSESGNVVDKDITILISGEERFWGEDCFWIETWYGLGSSSAPIAMLMSYSIFGDSLWRDRLELYHRKVIFGLDEETRQPMVQLMKRADLGAVRRKEMPSKGKLTMLFDTLGTDTVMVPKGTYTCQRIEQKQGLSATTDIGDSTSETDVWKNVVVYYNDEIPITDRVCEKQEDLVLSKKWKIGKSKDVVQNTLDRGLTELRLVDYGSGGLTPKLTPMSARQPLARTAAPPAPATTRKGTPRRRTG